MRIGVPSEVKDNEYRVAVTPAGVRELALSGHEVLIQKGAGDGSSIPDDAFDKILTNNVKSALWLAALTLDDINWRAGELMVRGKGDRRERLPLPDDVGQALVAYLQRGRPVTAQGRRLFVRVRAPHGPMTTGAVSHVVFAAGQRAGLGTVRAHRLRHTAATQLLAAGAPLVEIGQLLRHRSQLTTTIYAKVDIEGLRTLARPWPGGVA
jgi:site-specific recombinase XerC